MVKCRDNTFYTGVTNNLDKRISEHNLSANSSAYTFSRRPVKLVYSTIFIDIRKAINFEKQLKGWNRKKKLALITNNWSEIIRLSKRRS